MKNFLLILRLLFLVAHFLVSVYITGEFFDKLSTPISFVSLVGVIIGVLAVSGLFIFNLSKFIIHIKNKHL